MKFRSAIAAFVLTTSGLTGAGLAVSAESASAATCTKTASGTCIKGGQFCAKAKKNKAGYDARGRRYVCKVSKGTLHWMK